VKIFKKSERGDFRFEENLIWVRTLARFNAWVRSVKREQVAPVDIWASAGHREGRAWGDTWAGQLGRFLGEAKIRLKAAKKIGKTFSFSKSFL
jgi:hypothetical protein